MYYVVVVEALLSHRPSASTPTPTMQNAEEDYLLLMLSDSNLPTGTSRWSDARWIYCLHGARVVLLARVYDTGAAELGVVDHRLCGTHIDQLY